MNAPEPYTDLWYADVIAKHEKERAEHLKLLAELRLKCDLTVLSLKLKSEECRRANRVISALTSPPDAGHIQPTKQLYS